MKATLSRDCANHVRLLFRLGKGVELADAGTMFDGILLGTQHHGDLDM